MRAQAGMFLSVKPKGDPRKRYLSRDFQPRKNETRRGADSIEPATPQSDA